MLDRSLDRTASGPRRTEVEGATFDPVFACQIAVRPVASTRSIMARGSLTGTPRPPLMSVDAEKNRVPIHVDLAQERPLGSVRWWLEPREAGDCALCGPSRSTLENGRSSTELPSSAEHQRIEERKPTRHACQDTSCGGVDLVPVTSAEEAPMDRVRATLPRVHSPPCPCNDLGAIADRRRDFRTRARTVPRRWPGHLQARDRGYRRAVVHLLDSARCRCLVQATGPLEYVAWRTQEKPRKTSHSSAAPGGSASGKRYLQAPSFCHVPSRSQGPTTPASGYCSRRPTAGEVRAVRAGHRH